MFTFFSAIIRNIKSLFGHKQPPVIIRETLPPDKLSASQKVLLLGGLTLLLFGMAYGAIYGSLFLGKLHVLEAEQMSSALYYASKGDFESAEKFYKETVKTSSLTAALPSVHSHINSFALIALITSGIIPKMKLKEGVKIAGAILLLGGALVMSAGIVIELVNKTIGMIFALGGGSCVMASVALIMWGLILHIKDGLKE